jgi:hypothetical protein
MIALLLAGFRKRVATGLDVWARIERAEIGSIRPRPKLTRITSSPAVILRDTFSD